MNPTKIKLNKEIAELCGIILGDGHIHKSCNRITITGSLDDEVYHKKRVSKLFQNNFNAQPIFFKQKHKNAHYIQIESKNVMDYLTKIGLSRGSKTNIATPYTIKNNKELIIYFLRGLFDTDGCLKFSKQSRNLSYYPRVRITAKKSQMAENIGILLRTLNFKYSMWMDKRTKNTIVTYEISGKENAQKWFSLIRPNNPNKVKKYKFWLNNGYYQSLNG